MGSLFQTVGVATYKTGLSKLSLVLGTISYCGIYYRRCLGIFEKCRRLAK